MNAMMLRPIDSSIAPPGKRMDGLGMKGFTKRDDLHRAAEALQGLSKWMDEGQLTTRERALEGIECFPSAVKMIFAAENRGKLMIRVR